MDSKTLAKQRLESYVQDEIMEWQIFSTDYVDTYKLACKVISIMNEKPDIEPYQLGHSTLSLLMDHYTCEKVFAFEEKDYYDFGKALLNARKWAKETDAEEADEEAARSQMQDKDEKSDDDDENASEDRTISLIGKSYSDLKHFTKEDVLSMWKSLGSGKQKGTFTKSNLISEILTSKASKVTFTSKFHRSLDLSKMEVFDLLFVLSHDQLIAAAGVVLCKKDYVAKSDEEVAQSIKAQKSSHLIGI